MKKNRLNFILPHTFYKCGKNIYSEKPYFYEELKKYFDLNIFCRIKIISNDEVDKNDLVLMKNITFHNFFEQLDVPYFFLNFFKIKKKLLKIKLSEKDLYFIYYPHFISSLIVGYMLKKENLVIWVRSNPIAQFSIHGNFFQRLFRNIFKPFISILYESICKNIFRKNLIFYTGDITHNKSNHINQYQLISCFPFNRNKKLISDKSKLNFEIIFIGNESSQKGLTLLIKALSSLNHSLNLNIIGMEKFSSSKNVFLSSKLNINFYGKVYNRDNFYQILSKNNILVMPSYGEKQGKVQLEAMSVGVVPICSDSGGTYRTIDNYYNGLLFKEGDWKDLKQKIELLYQDQELYKDLQQNGLEFISELSVEKQVKKMSKIINNYYRER